MILVLLLPEGQLAGMVPEIVVADVDLDTAEIDVGGVGAYRFRKWRSWKRRSPRWQAVEEIFEPGDGLQIQVCWSVVEYSMSGLPNRAWASSTRTLSPPSSSSSACDEVSLWDAQAVQQHSAASDSASEPFTFGERRLQSAERSTVCSGKISLGVERLGVEHHVMKLLCAL